MITIYREDNPSETRQVSEDSFRRWPAGDRAGSKKGGAFDWAIAENGEAPKPKPIRVPDIITQVMGKAHEPEPEAEVKTAAETVKDIEAAETAAEVDAIAKGDERITVAKAAEKRKAHLG